MTQNCCFDTKISLRTSVQGTYTQGPASHAQTVFDRDFGQDIDPVPTIEVSGNFPHYIAKFDAQKYLPVRLTK